MGVYGGPCLLTLVRVLAVSSPPLALDVLAPLHTLEMSSDNDYSDNDYYDDEDDMMLDDDDGEPLQPALLRPLSAC